MSEKEQKLGLCNNCVSATYPFHADKHPRRRWCSKISLFVKLDDLCEFFMERNFTERKLTKIEPKLEPEQLELF